MADERLHPRGAGEESQQRQWKGDERERLDVAPKRAHPPASDIDGKDDARWSRTKTGATESSSRATPREVSVSFRSSTFGIRLLRL
ncbi:tRNA (uracil-5-)-methyltransferase [Anopheles sinensis]|uniref:tRNA (Uracil-5-)-methyltransferase n=1 Tax=Anopheles sinensis TaxID=74873 RepID=A0A084W289_ANOSI|nr:tRNA (uracil-5-)-methyltransferase [Anopheles sinensis]